MDAARLARLALTLWLFSPIFTPMEIEEIKKLEIGATFEHVEPRDDGCNKCTVEYRKVSATEVKPTMHLRCTLLYCPFDVPLIEFERPPKQLPGLKP